MGNDKILPVTILTHLRPQYLQRTICSFIEQNESSLDMFSLRLLVQGGLDQGTSDVLREWGHHFDFVDVRKENVGIARGYNICMQEALSLKTPYLLHLQDDWESKEPFSDYLPEIFGLMDADSTIGYIRLRSIHEEVSGMNRISRKSVRWYRGSGSIMVGNAHFTLNPTILHRNVVKRMIPIEKEHHAQQKYHELGLQVAQLDANCFCHIGAKRVKKGKWLR